MKTVLITGACVNTGVAIVEKFASEGYNIIFTGRNTENVRIKENEYKSKFPDAKVFGYALESLIANGKRRWSFANVCRYSQ